MLPTSEMMYYHDISPLAIKNGHLSGLTITIRLQGFSAVLLKIWIAARERLQLGLYRNGSAFSMVLDYAAMSACEYAMRVMFPRLRYVTGYITHFDASCSLERGERGVDFSMLALSRQ